MLFFRFWPRNLVLWDKTFGKREFVIKVGKHCDESLFVLSRFLRLSFKNIFSWPQNQDSIHLTCSSQISTWGCSTQRFHASNVAIVGKMDSNTISDLIMDRIISSPFALMLAFAEIKFYNKILGNILRYEGKGILLSRIRQKISWRVSYRVGVPSKR